MKKEVKIILEPDVHKSKNGTVFEELIRLILEKQDYQVRAVQRIVIISKNANIFIHAYSYAAYTKEILSRSVHPLQNELYI